MPLEKNSQQMLQIITGKVCTSTQHILCQNHINQNKIANCSYYKWTKFKFTLRESLD